MRITGGTHRSVPLYGPQDDRIRPTSDKARLAIFNKLQSLDGMRVLDGTAGTGAMGLEALSRGAAFVHFVEPAGTARALIKRNIEKLKIPQEKYALHGCAAEKLSRADKAADLIFLDPPYGKNLLPLMVKHLIANNWTDENTLFVLEEDKQAQVTLPLDIMDRKNYGAAQVIYARMPN